MRHALCLLLLAGCVGPADPSDVTSSDHALVARGGTLWPVPVIPVCWLGSPYPSWANEKQYVQDAVSSSWAFYAPVTFSGWGDCVTDHDPGIRICIDDVRPNAVHEGTEIAVPGCDVTLDFLFQNFEYVPCNPTSWWVGHDTKGCIQSHARHEFGHVLGYDHEQDREDNANGQYCNDPIDTATDPTGIYLTSWYDTASIMNYCNGNRAAGNVLSPGDIYGHQNAYGWKALDGAFGVSVNGRANIAAVSRVRNFVDTFLIGSDGKPYVNYGWHGSGLPASWVAFGGSPPAFPPGGLLTAVSRTPETEDVFGVAQNGGIYRTEYNGSTGFWGTWTRVGTLTVPVGAQITALSRGSLSIELFVVASSGGVYYLSVGFGVVLCRPSPCPPPPDWVRIGSGATFMPVAAASRAPNLLDVFLRGEDGFIYTASRADGGSWVGWTRLNSTSAWAYAPVTAAARPNMLDVFFPANDNFIHRLSWTPQTGWIESSSGASGQFVYNTTVTAVTRDPDTVDVFAVGNDGTLDTSWLDTTQSARGVERAWYPLSTSPDSPDSFTPGAPVTAFSHGEGVIRNEQFAIRTLTGWTLTRIENGVTGPGSAQVVDAPVGGELAAQIGDPTYTPGHPSDTTLSQWIQVPMENAALSLTISTTCTPPNSVDSSTVELRDASGALLWSQTNTLCGGLIPMHPPIASWGGRAVELRVINHDDGVPSAGGATTTELFGLQLGFRPSADLPATVTDVGVSMDLYTASATNQIRTATFDH